MGKKISYGINICILVSRFSLNYDKECLARFARSQKMIFKGSGCFQFPKAVVTSTVNESLRSTEHGSLQVLAVL